MSESGRQRLISSTPHLAPDEIANRSFSKGVRGFSESEVRAFLKRVSDEMAAVRERENDLLATIDSLEEQLRQPRPLTEQELLDSLGEETARLLRSAREAGDEIRAKAEERAAVMRDEARVAAEQARASADEAVAQQKEAADARVNEMLAAAETRAMQTRDTAATDAETMLEAARHQGREMLDEAKSARERVLTDLVRRRALLQSQIEELRGGRDRLLDAYRTVKRTFLEATEALAQVEARAASERANAAAEPIDIAAEVAAEIEALDAGTDVGGGADADPDATQMIELVEIEQIEIVEVEVEGVSEAGAETEDEGALADVDSLFARLRAGHADDPAPEPGVVVTDVTTEVAIEVEAEPAADAPDAPAAEAAADEEPAETEAEPEALVAVTATEWRAKRAREVDPLLAPLLKRTKRTAQNDQNALLDAVRRHKGRPTAAQVLPDTDAQIADWAEVLRDAVNQAYGAGRIAVRAEPADVYDDLVKEAAAVVVEPLRTRLGNAIDDDEGDTGGLVERIGARYREWKNQSLERSLAEVLALAWARGVYDAVPDGAVMWWVPFEEGRCSDCDDNALEPTVKGKEFPTGQPFPPAHPGCRCLLAPAELLQAAGTN
jgi:DivIVA domain-containing protein